MEGPPAGPETCEDRLWLPLSPVSRMDVFLQLQPSLLHYVSHAPLVVKARPKHYISYNLRSSDSINRSTADEESGPAASAEGRF